MLLAVSPQGSKILRVFLRIQSRIRSFNCSFNRANRQTRTMAIQNIPPFAPQDTRKVSDLVKALEANSKKHDGGRHAISCKKHTYQVPELESGSVDSWQFRDWDYKRRDLPTYARGLFTYTKRDGSAEIAVRGYDKFFNVGEVHETNWENVKSMTQAPYELSVKENGCIIFIAGLEGNVLLVCSKHSTGARDNANLSHAVAGERWVERHLNAIGKTKEDLAAELRRRNVTLVAELCDDDFEEHVLAYEPKDAGLYIHGMNLNLPEFTTYSSENVHQFADQWGFKKAQYLIKDDVDSMRKFLTDCAETGSYAGRDTEGFVIRCRRKVHGGGGNYQDWFFKYKFEEPYLMYRQWRECTKAIISGKPPKYKKHKQITEQYLQYARRQLAKDSSLGKAYQQNHGIIAMRDGFLREKGLTGAHIIQQEEQEHGASADAVTNNVVLVPVATLGCGKTTVAIALTKLFNWGHVQNDNIQGKSNRPRQFATQICNTLAAHPAMIADRNNHQKRERQQIINDVLAVVPDVRFVALHYVHDPKPQMLPDIRRVTQERIFSRGDNHQTIQAGTKDKSEILGIMEGFLNRFEPVNPHSDPDDAFDNIIDLDVASSSRQNLETVVQKLHSMYPNLVKAVPTSEELDEAIDAALSDYKPDIKHDLSFKSKKDRHSTQAGAAQSKGQVHSKLPNLEYFAIKLPTTEVLSNLDKVFNDLAPENAKMYRQLQQSRRVQPSFHVTLIHRASISSHPDLWSHLTSLHAETLAQQSKNPSTNVPDAAIGKCRVRLERVVWDDRVMCIVARLLDEGWETANSIAHVTVGTASQNIKPKESNDLLQRWLESGTQTGIGESEISGHVEVYGSVKAVMQQR